MTTIIAQNLKSDFAEAVLREIPALMQRLLETGESGTIDLRSLPMSDWDRQELARRLGEGEVKAFVNVGGTSTVSETQFAGVWWVRHEGADGRIAAEQVVVARAPEFLLAHPADIGAAQIRLSELLSRSAEAQNGEAGHG
ncbi:MAG: hydrogenase expression/formation C-terminal domain-containing protein [Rhodomicrobium sp.]